MVLEKKKKNKFPLLGKEGHLVPSLSRLFLKK